MLLSCRAAISICLRARITQHALLAARLLSVKGEKPSDPKPNPDVRSRGRPAQRSSSKRSSNSDRSSSSSSAHRSVLKPFQAEGDPIQKSQALTAHIGELGSQRRWQDVIRALETAENSGQKLYVNNFSAAIAALTRSKQPERALQLLPLMQDRGLKPTVVTYTTLIDACSKSGQWQQAVNLLREALAKGMKPTVQLFTATIDAYSSAGLWQQAIAILREMVQCNVMPNIQSYNSAVDACSGSGRWQQAVELLREMQQQQLVVPNIRTYNRVINACQNGGNWQLAVDLLTELKAADLQPDIITFNCVVGALHAANEHEKAEELYIETFKQGLIQSHWSTRVKGMLDFHVFSEGMAAAAMRIVLRDTVSDKARAHSGNASVSYVHPIANDLHIITGHAMNREERDGSVLQPVLIAMLKELGMQCYVNPENKGRLLITSSELQQYAARCSSRHKT
jgi:pentatricopeptide repeat protein